MLDAWFADLFVFQLDGRNQQNRFAVSSAPLLVAPNTQHLTLNT